MEKRHFTPKVNLREGNERIIFVYGSLKSGHSNHYRIADMKGKVLGQVETLEGFKLFYYEPYKGRGIATMVRNRSGGTVLGELVYIPDIRILNKFEGHPYYYRLEPILVECEEQNLIISTFAYIFQNPSDLTPKTSIEIIDGDYREEDWSGPDF